jgi:hypothetical protein
VPLEARKRKINIEIDRLRERKRAMEIILRPFVGSTYSSLLGVDF